MSIRSSIGIRNSNLSDSNSVKGTNMLLHVYNSLHVGKPKRREVAVTDGGATNSLTADNVTEIYTWYLRTCIPP